MLESNLIFGSLRIPYRNWWYLMPFLLRQLADSEDYVNTIYSNKNTVSLGCCYFLQTFEVLPANGLGFACIFPSHITPSISNFWIFSIHRGTRTESIPWVGAGLLTDGEARVWLLQHAWKKNKPNLSEERLPPLAWSLVTFSSFKVSLGGAFWGTKSASTPIAL